MTAAEAVELGFEHTMTSELTAPAPQNFRELPVKNPGVFKHTVLAVLLLLLFCFHTLQTFKKTKQEAKYFFKGPQGPLVLCS